MLQTKKYFILFKKNISLITKNEYATTGKFFTIGYARKTLT